MGIQIQCIGKPAHPPLLIPDFIVIPIISNSLDVPWWWSMRRSAVADICRDHGGRVGVMRCLFMAWSGSGPASAFDGGVTMCRWCKDDLWV